jgi:hypothetical protein
MARLIITSADTKPRTSTRSDFTWNQQKALIEMGLERREIDLALENGQSAYNPGIYDIDYDKSLEFGRFNQLQLKFVWVLKYVGPLPVANKAA